MSGNNNSTIEVNLDRVQFLNGLSNQLVLSMDLPAAVLVFQATLWAQTPFLSVSVVDQTEQFIRQQQRQQYDAAYHRQKVLIAPNIKT